MEKKIPKRVGARMHLCFNPFVLARTDVPSMFATLNQKCLHSLNMPPESQKTWYMGDGTVTETSGYPDLKYKELCKAEDFNSSNLESSVSNCSCCQITCLLNFTKVLPPVTTAKNLYFRHWQDLGYLILYVSARPDMQHRKVVSWLAQHNFPHGLVSFMDGLSKDPLRQKFNYICSLMTEVCVHVYACWYVCMYACVYDRIKINR